MSETKKETPITIDDNEYILEDMSEEQQQMINHVSDLDRKIGNSKFNLDQLLFGRNAFMTALKDSLLPEPLPEKD
jgi:hypothetical protein